MGVRQTSGEFSLKTETVSIRHTVVDLRNRRDPESKVWTLYQKGYEI